METTTTKELRVLPAGRGKGKTEFRAIHQAITEVEGRATARCLTVLEVMEIAKKAEARLDKVGTTQAERVGAIAIWDPPQPPNSYRKSSHGQAPMGTTVTLRRTATAWMLTSVERVQVQTASMGMPGYVRVVLPAAVHQAVASRHLVRIGVEAAE